jgi:diacylglycerol O-acyltransferase
VHRMTGMDAAFLYMETPTMHMHVVGVVALDPGGLTTPFDTSVVVKALEDRLHLIPPLRRRAVFPPGSIDHPLWIEDPGFDVHRHVAAAPLFAPVSWHALEQYVGEVASRPLDRSRPLWEMWVVEGMEDGSVVLVTKLHHSIMDGAAGGELMASLFDLTKDAGAVAPPSEPWVPDSVPSALRQVTGSVASMVARQKDVPAAAARAFSNLAGTARTWMAQRREGTAVPLLAPRTPLNGALSAARSVSLAKVSLEDVKSIRRAFGTTVNDVVLAASGTALRSYLKARGAPTEEPLVVAVPVSARGGEPGGELGNRISNMMVSLALEPDDPVERLRAVHESANASKALQSAFGTDSLQELTGFTAPSVIMAGTRLYSGLRLARFHSPVFNLIISNVPGPPIDLFCAGARVTAIFPMGPVMEGSGINITVLSEADHLNIGVMACPDIVPDVDKVGEAFVDAVDELLQHARSLG